MTKTIINLTPHVCTIITNYGSISIEPSGTVARCAQSTTIIGKIKIGNFIIPVPTGVNQFGKIENLPEPKENTLYFVSALVASAAWAERRTDVVCPLKAVRNDSGQIIGTEGFALNPSLI